MPIPYMTWPQSPNDVTHSPIQLTQAMFANPQSPIGIITMKSTQYENITCIYKHSHYKFIKESRSHSNPAIAPLQEMVLLLVTKSNHYLQILKEPIKSYPGPFHHTVYPFINPNTFKILGPKAFKNPTRKTPNLSHYKMQCN